MSCCGNQWSEIKKYGADECFSCLGNSTPLMLDPKHVYPSCSPLVEGETKNSPLRPMTTPDESIVAWVGPQCDIDASEWEEACAQHVYAKAVVYKDRANWPCTEEGASVFSVEEIELIVQGHPCMFDCIQKCEPAREWLSEIEAANQSKLA